MSYKTYEKYKNIKISWIDKIPSTWNIIKAKHCFKLSGGYAFKSDDFIEEGIPLVRIGDISNGTIDFDNCKRLPLEYAVLMKEFLVKPGDILIALTGATIGKIGQVPKTNEKILLNQRVGKLSSDKSNYYKYILSSDLIKKQIMLIADGSAQENISNEDIGNFEIFDVDNNTKQQIANYLDKKTSKIDTTIAKNKELINLLEEKRTALINQVVTKGLNPEVPMKDSGIEWIGEIPEHWEIIKLKYCAEIINEKKDFANVDDKYIGLEHIESETGKLLKYSDDGADGTVNKFKKDMVLFGKLRPYLAKVINTSFDGVCSTELLVFKTKSHLLSTYLFYVMLSNRFIEQVNSSTYGVKMPRASPEFITSLPITIPDLSEQKQIASCLDSKISNINGIITKIKENINLLDEYKTSLIHHVVTGKIDVRCEN